jgi:predicted ATPase/transcriptional regulator with XRE-family HTH domain
MHHPPPVDEVHLFGSWLRRQRKAFDWTQRALAQRVGCTAATIRKIEAGERKPSRQLAELLATVLGVPDEERGAFLQVARQVQAVATVVSNRQSLIATEPADTSLYKPFSNLPALMTSLVNRVHDVTNVTVLLADPDVRLLTLLGPPGIGKTRLAIHIAEQVAAHFQDGVWFVDLAPLTDAALVLPTIAYVLTIGETAGVSIVERLCVALAEKQLLLVLDNCEQVITAATEVGVLLRGCKGLKVLATSRTPLLLAGEYEYTLPPLSLPPNDLVPTMQPAQLLDYEAVQLLVARMRQHQHTFALTAANADAIVTICRRLDGLPLALELAAAALRRMSLKQLVAILHNEATWLHDLHSPARDLPSRQRTLYQAIAWSYNLLNAEQQTIFRQLGCFVGGFAADMAQAVCNAGQTTLSLLTEHNLLVHTTGRWQMLEMIREFALTQMTSIERTAVQQRYAAYFVAQAVSDLDLLARDHANFRAALLWAIDAQDVHAALTLCTKLCWFWETRGYLREGITLARATLALSNWVTNGSGADRPDAVDAALRIDLLERVATLAWLGHYFDIAVPFAEEAATLARHYDYPGRLALAFHLLGRIFMEQGEYDDAEHFFQESTELARQVAHLFNPGCPLTQLSEIALARGDWVAAQAYLADAIPNLVQTPTGLHVNVHIAVAYTNLAEIALAHGDSQRAHRELQQAFPQARLYSRRLRCWLLTFVGVMLQTPSPTSINGALVAAELLGTVGGLGERSGDPLAPYYQERIAQRAARVQKLLTKSEFQAAWQQGHGRTLVQAVTEAERWLASDFTA